MKPIVLLFSLLTVSLFMGGCNNTGDDGDDGVTAQSAVIDEAYLPTIYNGWYRPDTSTTWQWQLSGNVNTRYNVDLYDIDLFDNSAEFIATLKSSGKKVICYFSAGSYENWRPDIGSFQSSDLGNNLENWAGEKWLDIRSANVRSIMQARLDLAAEKGCDGVEPDNMDGYLNNPGFVLTAENQLDYNRFIANEAHDRNLSVGLKNDVDQLGSLVEYYDFAVNEECFAYDECANYSLFTERDKAVFNAEYEVRANEVTKLCAQANAALIKTLILPWELDDSSRASCQEE